MLSIAASLALATALIAQAKAATRHPARVRVVAKQLKRSR